MVQFGPGNAPVLVHHLVQAENLFNLVKVHPEERAFMALSHCSELELSGLKPVVVLSGLLFMFVQLAQKEFCVWRPFICSLSKTMRV